MSACHRLPEERASVSRKVYVGPPLVILAALAFCAAFFLIQSSACVQGAIHLSPSLP